MVVLYSLIQLWWQDPHVSSSQECNKSGAKITESQHDNGILFQVMES